MIKAQYTVVLKTLLDNPETSELIHKALSKYPLYEKKSKEEWIPSIVPTRDELNAKILNFYKYREIGFETVGRFIDELEISMAEIMPYYNQLLFTLDQDYNILYNVDYDRAITVNRDGTTKNETVGTSENETTSTEDTQTTTTDKSTNTSSATDKGTTTNSATDQSKTVHSDTPQGQLDITAANINNVDYADSVQWNDHDTTGNTQVLGETSGKTEIDQNGTNTVKGTNNVTGNSTNNIVEDGTKSETEETHERTKGNYGQMSYQYLVAKYRELIMNIEQRIINDHRISELFMKIY